MGKTYTKRNSDVNPAKQQQTREDKRGRQEELLGFSSWEPPKRTAPQQNGRNYK